MVPGRLLGGNSRCQQPVSAAPPRRLLGLPKMDTRYTGQVYAQNAIWYADPDVRGNCVQHFLFSIAVNVLSLYSRHIVPKILS